MTIRCGRDLTDDDAVNDDADDDTTTNTQSMTNGETIRSTMTTPTDRLWGGRLAVAVSRGRSRGHGFFLKYAHGQWTYVERRFSWAI
jgi:hypothetical protein